MSLIEFKNISKKFGQFTALSDISLKIEKNTIHSIIGENGAGKSTLVKILVGIEQASSGEMSLRGQIYRPHSARDAFDHKIGLVHQHFQLADELTGWDHLKLVVSNQSLNFEDLQKKTNLILNQFGWSFNLNERIKTYSVGEQQRLEILRVLILEPEIVIFDEPTAVLSPDEIQDFLNFMFKLKEHGHTLILISHKLAEIKKVSDDVTILCRGQLTETASIENLTIEIMAEKMIGRKQKSIAHNLEKQKNLQKSKLSIQSLNLELMTYEIMGVAGVEGNGQSQFIDQLLTELKGLNYSIADISEDRYRFSIYPKQSLIDNFLIRHRYSFSNLGLLNKTAVRDIVNEIIIKWDVRPQNADMLMGDLSGGNQQKYVIGRELWHDPNFILAAHPSRGVDIGAQEQIHQALINEALLGKCVVLLSSDLDEILKLSHRFIILFKGRIFGPFLKDQLSLNQISQIMNGVYENKIEL